MGKWGGAFPTWAGVQVRVTLSQRSNSPDNTAFIMQWHDLCIGKKKKTSNTFQHFKKCPEHIGKSGRKNLQRIIWCYHDIRIDQNFLISFIFLIPVSEITSLFVTFNSYSKFLLAISPVKEERLLLKQLVNLKGQRTVDSFRRSRKAGKEWFPVTYTLVVKMP